MHYPIDGKINLTQLNKLLKILYETKDDMCNIQATGYTGFVHIGRAIQLLETYMDMMAEADLEQKSRFDATIGPSHIALSFLDQQG
jgi:hypothetical protein